MNEDDALHDSQDIIIIQWFSALQFLKIILTKKHVNCLLLLKKPLL